MRKEGCSIHWKYIIRLANKPFISCTEDGYKKYTRSKSGRCPDHIRGFYTSQYYYNLRNEVVSIQNDNIALIQKAINNLLLELSENKNEPYNTYINQANKILSHLLTILAWS